MGKETGKSDCKYQDENRRLTYPKKKTSYLPCEIPFYISDAASFSACSSSLQSIICCRIVVTHEIFKTRVKGFIDENGLWNVNEDNALAVFQGFILSVSEYIFSALGYVNEHEGH